MGKPNTVEREVPAAAEAERVKVVYTSPPLSLARLLGPAAAGRWRVEAHGAELEVEAAPDVDPALLAEVVARGGRVLLEASPDEAPRVAGVLQVRRALELDEHGDVRAKVRTFELRATKDFLLTTGRAMLRADGEDLELYGREVLTRAREVAKILGRMITLN